mmetsp:Transcript_56689/g.160811  ORF Transcript_56689/g.160811 Transcript_56689/m.160811 type:complete len:258 (-) Transcript_56689:1182-1955(-)
MHALMLAPTRGQKTSAQAHSQPAVPMAGGGLPFPSTPRFWSISPACLPMEPPASASCMNSRRRCRAQASRARGPTTDSKVERILRVVTAWRWTSLAPARQPVTNARRPPEAATAAGAVFATPVWPSRYATRPIANSAVVWAPGKLLVSSLRSPSTSEADSSRPQPVELGTPEDPPSKKASQRARSCSDSAVSVGEAARSNSSALAVRPRWGSGPRGRGSMPWDVAAPLGSVPRCRPMALKTQAAMAATTTGQTALPS